MTDSSILNQKSKNENFRLLINSICQRLSSDSLKELKFQCRSYIGVGKLERIN